VVVLATAGVLGPPRPAAADPAEPGNVRSRVVGIEPPVAGLVAEVVGGDSFLRLSVPRGQEVVVLGYESEPYLRFRADGVVERNTRSPAAYLNETRYAEVDVPASADAGAEPRWEEVARGGTYAWHDHRVHWMASTRPDPPVQERVVPLMVDGAPAEVQVRFRALDAPSPVAWLALSALLALVLVAVAVRAPKVPVLPGSVLVTAALVAVVGMALRRLPFGSPTGTTTLLLGVVALAGGTAGALARRPAVQGACLAGAGAALLIVGARRFSSLTSAVLVTSLPAPLDRLSVALSLGVGTAAVATGVRSVLAAPRPAPAQAG
jgi:hypothetical protein